MIKILMLNQKKKEKFEEEEFNYLLDEDDDNYPSSEKNFDNNSPSSEKYVDDNSPSLKADELNIEAINSICQNNEKDIRLLSRKASRKKIK